MATVSRAADLKTLGLSANADKEAVKRAYYKRAKQDHPDKGGTKEAFQALYAAFERLNEDNYTKPKASTPAQSYARSTYYHPTYSSDDYYDDDEFNYGDYSSGYTFFPGFSFWESFFRRAQGSSSGYEYEDFSNMYEKTAKQRAKERARRVKKLEDYRDHYAEAGEDCCSTCNERAGITQSDARSHGLNWSQYNSHPLKYKTCWACKNAHNSVMTKAKAQAKMKVLKEWNGWYTLKSFTHAPVTKFATKSRRSQYFWVKDLQQQAEALGWKPRQRKRNSKSKPKAEPQAKPAPIPQTPPRAAPPAPRATPKTKVKAEPVKVETPTQTAARLLKKRKANSQSTGPKKKAAPQQRKRAAPKRKKATKKSKKASPVEAKNGLFEDILEAQRQEEIVMKNNLKSE